GDLIRIQAARPQDGPTTKSDDPKEDFVTDDIIHISAQFMTAENKGATTEYACLKFDGTQWIPTDNTDLRWEEGYTSATFTAYYFPSKNALSVGGADYQLLNGMNGSNDPLKATVSNVPAGGAVYLQFAHLCTKLTLTDLKEKGKDNEALANNTELWLTTASLNNGCQLIRGNDGTLTFEWAKLKTEGEHTVPAEESDNIYISNNSVSSGQTTFYLEPGDYSNMKLNFAKNKAYLTFGIEQLSSLEAGKHYTLDITNLPGNAVSGELKEEEYWNDAANDGTIKLNDINAFLTAIYKGDQYIEDGQQILDVISQDNHTEVVMLKNVDFDSKPFTPVELGNSITFDGNYHTIHNVKSPSGIFTTLSGKAHNLTIENATITGETNQTNIGVLANEVSGSLDNIKLTGTLLIKPQPNSTGNMMIGALVGNITNASSSLTNIEINGQLTMKISKGSNDLELYLGGLAGHNAGTIENAVIACSTSSNIAITATASSLRIGGITGSTDGKITHCQSNLPIDASGASSTIAYIGGLAGIVKVDITSCDVSGDVKGSKATGGSDGMPALTCTGGLVGSVEKGTLDDCQSLADVTAGATEGDNSSAITGGLAGYLFISTDNYNTENITLINCASLGAITPGSSTVYGALVGKGEKKEGATLVVKNSFSLSKLTGEGISLAFIGENTEPAVTVTNCHFNKEGQGVSESGGSLLDKLNAGKENGSTWIEGIYGTDCPYLTRK
ncbi:MAG: fimbrillin family protein, partial [Parabacteroides gordonii]|nr:fimbrillin family protein [Parabacteroides gordonii]